MGRRITSALLAVVVAAAIPGVALGKKDDAPKVGHARVADVTTTTAAVQTDVDTGGLAATYVVEWSAAGAPAARTPATALPAARGKQPITATLSGLTPGTSYTVRVVATSAGGTEISRDAGFTTVAERPAPSAPSGGQGRQDGKKEDKREDRKEGGANGRQPAPAPAPAPNLLDGPVAAPSDATLGRDVVVGVATGFVKVKVPGTDGFTALGPGAAVPVGSVVDATRGTVRLTTAVQGGTQDALVGGAKFEVRQARDGGGMTDLVLRGGDFSACRPGVVARSAAVANKARRRLWAKDDSGRFRTRGRHSVATVRGTEWTTTDTCRGTTTSVREGAVSVASVRTGRSVLVRAGGHFFQPAPRR